MLLVSRFVMKAEAALQSAPDIESLIREIRGCKVILDADLARIHGVPVSRFNEAVKRNADRFPDDFRFQLIVAERQAVRRLRSQFAILETGRGRHPKYLPWAFTEHGAIMAANVLNSPRAVQMSVFVVRAFVSLRRMLANHDALSRKLAELERRVEGHDRGIKSLFDAIRELMTPPARPRREIGFHARPEPPVTDAAKGKKPVARRREYYRTESKTLEEAKPRRHLFPSDR